MSRRRLQLAGTALIMLVLVFILALVVTYHRTQPRWLDASGLNGVLLERKDLPSGWRSWNQYSYALEVDEGLGVARVFGPSAGPSWVHVKEHVYMYEGQVAASEAYQELLAKYSRFELQGWEQVPFARVDVSADVSHIVCTEGYVDGFHHYACSFVALYGNLVVDLAANIFDDRWATAEDFRAVVAAVDRKMVIALE